MPTNQSTATTSPTTISATKKAAVIDDAFDSVVEDEIELNDLKRFYQAVKKLPNFATLCQKHSFDISSIDNLDESDDNYLKFLNILWKEIDEYADIQPLLVNYLFRKKSEKLSDLKKICANLRLLGIDVQEYGSQITQEQLSKFGENKYNYIFIDYFLGVQENEQAIKNAAEKIKIIHEQYPVGEKPAIVLMSSANVEDKAEEFGNKAKILEGIFRFSGKQDLEDGNILSLTIGVLANEFSNRDELQQYVTTLIDAASEGLNTFIQNIKNLKTEDYIIIQHLVLQGDKQPLGDYLSWLYGSYWENLLLQNNSLQIQKRAINSFYISDSPIMHRQPSDKLSEIYMGALFDTHSSDVGIHPAYKSIFDNNTEIPEGTFTPKDGNAYYLHLGDVFLKEEADTVWMILNAQCDLERFVHKDRSIFLIPGKLIPLNEAYNDKEGVVRTDFFRHNDKSYRIAWNVKGTLTQPYSKFHDWKTAEQCSRKYTLKMPFAIEIQQTFASTLTRVGMPVPPPLMEAIQVQVMAGKKGEEPIIILNSINKYATRIVTKAEGGSLTTRYIFTFDFLKDFKKALAEMKKTALKSLNEISDDPKGYLTLAAQKRVDKIEEILSSFESKFVKFKPMEIGEKPTSIGSIGVKKNASNISYESDNFVLINIVDVAPVKSNVSLLIGVE